MNYYDFMQINKNASEEVIKAAYKTLSKKYHPDVYNDGGQMMKHLNMVYETLMDKHKRAEYDMELRKVSEDAKADIEDAPNTSVEKDERTGDNKREKTFGEKILTVIIGVIYCAGTVLYYAWGIILVLIIMGLFTGHTQELFGVLFDGVINGIKNVLK